MRHTGAAVTLVTAILLGLLLIGPLIGDNAARLIGVTPGAALQRLAGVAPQDGPGAWPTVALAVAYSLLLPGGSAVLPRQRDV
ncbi:hypothetical protein [Actinoplanes sp. G11-F43]|uniref:hypothetical protein n=1 Tax=Actinoplanes sp. G11-F43 TaxID=3424130 RepID=UPI003D33F22F